MTKRKTKSDPPSSTVKPLPKSREALGLMLRSAEGMLGYLEPYVQAQGTRVRRLRTFQRCPPQTREQFLQFLEQVEFLKDVTKATRSRFAQGGPSWTALEPYLKSSGLDAIIRKRQLALRPMRELATRDGKRLTWEDLEPCLAAFAKLVAAEQEVIGLISELQHRIIAALDESARTGTDSNADRKREFSNRVPQNKVLTRLAEKIKRDRRHGALCRSDKLTRLRSAKLSHYLERRSGFVFQVVGLGYVEQRRCGDLAGKPG